MEQWHPSHDIRFSKSRLLENKVIVLGITGSVACLKSIELARTLMRHGARVIPVMSQGACSLLGPDLVHWATGEKPILSLSGNIEHVFWLGNVPKPADLFLVAPATANSIGKMACGIDDTPVTTCFTTALGEGIPVILVPAMHQAMYDHPIVLENIEKLKKNGVRVLDSVHQEGKAKIPHEQDIVLEVLKKIRNPGPLTGKNILITSGRTVEPLDPIRVITNNSSGRMGCSMAQAAWNMGAQVFLVYGKGTVEPPPGVETVKVNTAQEMLDEVKKKMNAFSIDLFIGVAAVGDWQAETVSEEKIPTFGTKSILINFIPTPKIIDQIKTYSPSTKVLAFRALHNKTEEEMIQDGEKRLKRAGADYIAINDVSDGAAGFESLKNKLILLDKEGSIHPLELAPKEKIAEDLLAIIAHKL